MTYLELRHVLLFLAIHLIEMLSKMLSLQVYSDKFLLLVLDPLFLLWGNRVTKSSLM